jgi:hypothetical protein
LTLWNSSDSVRTSLLLVIGKLCRIAVVGLCGLLTLSSSHMALAQGLRIEPQDPQYSCVCPEIPPCPFVGCQQAVQQGCFTCSSLREKCPLTCNAPWFAEGIRRCGCRPSSSSSSSSGSSSSASAPSCCITSNSADVCQQQCLNLLGGLCSICTNTQ